MITSRSSKRAAARTPEPRPRAAPPTPQPAGPANVISLRLEPGEVLSVSPAPPPEKPSVREDFDFLGGQFYMASRELSERLPHLGLTATDYDVWHTMLGKQLKGGLVNFTKTKIGELLGIDRTEAGKSIEVFIGLGLIWEEKRGRYRINPRIAFWGSSGQQQAAIAGIPDYVPEIVLPETKVRPPRRRRTKRLEGL